MAELRTFRIIAQNSTILLDDGKDGWILAGKLPAGLQAMGKLHRFVLNLMLYIRTVTRPLTFFIKALRLNMPQLSSQFQCGTLAKMQNNL